MTGKLFPDNSVQTTTTFSLTHEIESYIGREALEHFLRQVYEQTAPGGVYINSDVVGPEHGDQMVYMDLNREDGINRPPVTDQQITQDELEQLSTHSRFLQFAHDFRRAEHDTIPHTIVQEDGRELIELRLADACEFLSKKDYLDSWYSEMHERFCYWSFTDWKAAVRQAGFRVKQVSHAYRNDWIVDHRWRGKAALLVKTPHGLKALDYPVTNMLLVAEKY